MQANGSVRLMEQRHRLVPIRPLPDVRGDSRSGFTVYPAEWWHFDHDDWRRYRIQNLRFEEIPAG